MDPQRERIQADLRGLLHGEVRCDEIFTRLYATDASIFEIQPLGVVRPRHTADVVATVQYAVEHGVAIHARGAGTGLAGESLGPGLVLDFSYFMRRILETGPNTVRIQPGVVHANLNRHLARYGRLFGPDPANSAVTTMGSVLALDNTGSHWLKHGSPRRHVASLQVVLASGAVMEISRHALAEVAQDPVPARGELVGRLGDLLQREAAVIDAHRPTVAVSRAGYGVQGILAGGELDLARLVVGSEGTLALITEATLHTEPLPKFRGVGLLFFDRLDSAARAALDVPQMGASACDLMDRRLLSIAREADVRFDLLLPHDAEAMLLVQFDGDDPGQVRERLQACVGRLHRRKRLAYDARLAFEPDDIALFWRLTRHVVHYLYRLKGALRPVPIVEDIAVPPQVLPDFLVTLQNILKRRQVTASLFAHAGHGQLHVRPFLNLALPEHVRMMPALAEELYVAAIEVGGTISGEHGVGLSRTWFMRRMFGELYNVFREVKRIFDPQNVFNPGKVVADVPPPLLKHLRYPAGSEGAPVAESSAARVEEAMPLPSAEPPVAAPAHGGTAAEGESLVSAAAAGVAASPAARPSSELAEPPSTDPLVDLQLAWNGAELATATLACNSCGSCRTQSPDERMCPIFRFFPGEENSPRAKATLMRAALAGQVEADALTGDAFKEIADRCVNCHQCRLECPAKVDIPRLMFEAKAQHVATNGLSMADWFLGNLERFASWGTAFNPLANWALGNRQMRWLLEKSLGLSQARKLPRLASRTFLRRAQRQRLTRPSRRTDRKVLYFVDTYANFFDVQLAEALVAVMEHNGVSVYVHPKQQQAGMPWIAAGAAERARQLARGNIQILAEAVRQGYAIVTSEPAAALCLTHEYLNLLDSDDAHLVARSSGEATSYLWKLHLAGKLELNLKPLHFTVGYHLPCHVKALDAGTPGENLLRLIPGLVVKRLETGCSGMAGTFGLKRDNFRTSIRSGWGLITALRDGELQAGLTDCSACKIQMEQGTSKPTLHPLKLLALAYGLIPEISQLLSNRSEELTLK